MKQSALCAFLGGTFLFGAFDRGAHAEPFLETGGFVSFEAESAPFNGNWLLSTELNHYSGDGYLYWDGPDLFNASGAGHDVIVYQFQITTPGNYELRWRSRIAKGDSNTESNDSWVRFPSGVNIAGEEPLYGWSKVHMGHTGAWFWDAKINDHVGANVRQYFSAGVHSMEVSGRSNGHAIDKMALFRYEELELSPHDLDTRSGTPQASIEGNVVPPESPDPGNATLVASGLSYTPGECRDNVLVLPPTADVHLVNGVLENSQVLEIEPSSATSLMRFDTTAVPPFHAAALELAVVGGAGSASIEIALLNAAVWQESDNALDPPPQYVLQLALANHNWASGARYAIALGAGDIQSGINDFSIAAVASATRLSIASRENSLEMPLLVLTGTGAFCEDYRAASASSNTESGENTSGDSSADSEAEQQTGTDDEAVDTVDNSGAADTTTNGNSDVGNDADTDSLPANSASNSGGGSGGGYFLPLFLLLFVATGLPRRKISKGS